LRSTDLRANRRNFEKAGLAPAFLFAFQLVWISAGWCLLPAAAIAHLLPPENAARSNKPLMV
jgi:hypothetical protein